MKKAKKVLSLILTVAMVLSCMSMSVISAFAYSDVSTYEELVTAIAAGGTVYLESDITVEDQIQISKNVTLYLSGHTISVGDTAYVEGDNLYHSGIFAVKYGGTLTVRDYSGTGAIVSENPTVYAAIALTVKGEEFDGTNRAKLYVYGGTLKGYWYGIVGNGDRPGTDITISGGTITGTANKGYLGIYAPQNGTLTISGGTISGDDSAIECRAGTVNISGGTLTATGTPTYDVANSSGSTIVGAALGVAQHTTELPISVTITGGTFNAHKAIYVANPQGNTGADVAVSITGSKASFTSTDGSNDVLYLANNAIGKATITFDKCYMWKNKNELVKSAASAGTTGYGSLADALAAVPTDGTQTTVTLYEDVDYGVANGACVTIPANKNVVLDLNGHTIKASKADENVNVYVVKNEGTLEVKDSGSNGTILMDQDTTVWNIGTDGVAVENLGTFTLTSGTLKATRTNTGMIYALDNLNGATATVNGGKIISDYAGIRNYPQQYSANVTTVTVNNCTIEAQHGFYVQETNKNVKSSTVINGGKITGSKTVIYTDCKSTDEIIINGGYFKGGTYGEETNCLFCFDGSAKDNSSSIMTINGGYFANNQFVNGDPRSTYNMLDLSTLIADGYIVAPNADATYTYAVGTPVAQIDDVIYVSLQAALTAAEDGDTVTLLADTAESQLNFVNKNITLDLGDYDLTNASGFTINKYNSGTLTIKGTANSQISGIVRTYATKVVFDSTFEGKVEQVTVAGSNSFSVAGGYFKKIIDYTGWSSSSVTPTNYLADGYKYETVDSYYHIVPLTMDDYYASVTIGTETTYYTTLDKAFTAAKAGGTITLLKDFSGVLSTNANMYLTGSVTLDLNGKTWDLYNGSYNGTGIRLYTGDLTVKNGTILPAYSGCNVFEIEGGSLTIDSGVYYDADRGGCSITGSNGNGCKGTLVINDGTFGSISCNAACPSVTINGGTFNGTIMTAYNSTTPVTITDGTFNGQIYCNQSNTGTFAISGGTFNGDMGNGGGKFTITGGKFDTSILSTNDNASFTISGGVFTADPTTRSTVTLAEGCIVVANTDSATSATYPYAVGTPVAEIDGTQYISLADAVAAVPAGEETTITMIADETIIGNAGVTVPAGKEIILDLNGHTVKNLVNTNDHSQVIKNEGILTIVDSTDDNADGTGSGLLTNAVQEGTQAGDWWATPQRNYYTNVITNCGTLTIESGKLYQSSAGSICYAVDNQSGGCDATLNVNGGLVSAYGTAVRMCCGSTKTENILNMDNGTISGGNTGVWIHLLGNTATDAPNATFNVTGGTITGGSYSFYDYSYGNAYTNVNYTISNGIFNGGIFSYGANIAISGGIFNNYIGIKQAKAASTLSVTGGYFADEVYNYGTYNTGAFISGGYFADVSYGDTVYGPYADGATVSGYSEAAWAADPAPYVYTKLSDGTWTLTASAYDHRAGLAEYVVDGLFVVDNTEAATMDNYQFVIGEPVAKIGDTGYATLEDAIADAEPGDTIDVLNNQSADNVDIPDGITIAPADEVTVTIANSESDNMSADLDGVKAYAAQDTEGNTGATYKLNVESVTTVQDDIKDAATTAGFKKVVYFDATFTKTVGNNTEEIDYTGSALQSFTYTIEGTNLSDIMAYRYHGGETESFERIYDEANAGDGKFLVTIANGKTIVTIYTNKFSDYGVAYNINTPEMMVGASYAASLTLSDDIALNFKVKKLTKTGFDSSKLEIYVNGEKVDVTYDSSTNIATCVAAKLAPAEIYDNLHIEVLYDGDLAYSIDYSASTYCQNMISKGNSKANLYSALLDYGTAAKNYNAKVETESIFEERDYGDYEERTVCKGVGEDKTVTAANAELTLGSTVTIKYVVTSSTAITADNVVINNPKMQRVAKENIEITNDGDTYTILVKNRYATQLADLYTLRVEGISGFTCAYSVYDYCLSVENDDNKDELTKDLCYALYNYGVEASAYAS